jgi:hypothetical protein
MGFGEIVDGVPAQRYYPVNDLFDKKRKNRRTRVAIAEECFCLFGLSL